MELGKAKDGNNLLMYNTMYFCIPNSLWCAYTWTPNCIKDIEMHCVVHQQLVSIILPSLFPLGFF